MAQQHESKIPAVVQAECDEAVKEAETQKAIEQAAIEQAVKQVTETPAAEPAAPAPEPKPEIAPAEPQPAAQPDLTAELERLKAAHETLTGKFTKEVPRLHAKLREREAELRRLEAELAQAKTRPDTGKPADPDNPYALTEAERELGPEVMAVAEKVARRIAQQQAAELAARMPQPESPEDGFWRTLAEKMPDYDVVNADPRFAVWLGEKSNGVVRDKMLKFHQRELDAEAVSDMMQEWRKSLEPAPQPQPKTSSAKPSLAAQVTPNTVAASTQQPPEKRKWRKAEWEAQMDKIAQLTVTMPQRAAQLEAELDEAGREGRLLGA